ncbi:restriction endonuclease subunit S [[Clostridium] innocuum]|uniref:restriction endonuclease subunit S n=1 Tax=Clostridium innocuum TaxID=1522 RepID=UPI00321B3E0D
MKKPKIRFNGFNDDWEQRKFVEFVKNAAKKNKDNIDLEPYAVTNDRGFIAQKDAHDDFGYMSNVDRTAYNIVPPNSFAYNPARINVGSLGYYEGTENVIVSSLYEVFQTEEYIDDKFLLHWFKSDSFPRWIEKLQEGSVRLYFYFDKLVQCQMMVPSLEEQKRISAYLDSIDQLITLHQRKCDEIKKLKKYMLQNMFPQDEEKVPKIRFYGFTDDWEQRKLGDITESYSGGTPTAGKKEYYDGNIPFIRSGEISSDKTELFISEEGLNRSSAKMVKIGDILYALYGATSGEVSISKLKGAINQAILAIQPHQNYDSQFLMQWLRKSKENIIGTYLQGGQGNLSGNIVKELIIDIPTYEEQKEIGAYLKKLDHLITLHQRKCDELKNMKKFMLQNMFV